MTMRNRQLVAAWAYEQGKEQGVIERKTDREQNLLRGSGL